MALTILASGDSSGGGSGPFIQGSITALANLAWNISIGSVSPAQLESFVNVAAYQAEDNQPEGTQIELDISGWTFLGTDYSQQVASEINNYWLQGEFVVNGEAMQAWPGATQIAYGGGDTLTVQYIKGVPWIVYVAVAIALAFLVLYIVQLFSGQKWNLKAAVQSVTGNPSGNWYQRMNIIEKGLFWVGVGAVVIVGGYVGISYWERLSIAKAGASKSEQTIYVER